MIASTSASTSNGSSNSTFTSSASTDVIQIIPACITNPVVRDLYPALLEHNRTYGNPNIPLGTPHGRACEHIRRLKVQNKLSDAEIILLEQLQFRFYSLEQVYETSDFEDLFARLLTYAADHDGDVSPPKKYHKDPELGAWVTGVRRKGPESVFPQERVQRLEAIGFLWTSPRACGSKFMLQLKILSDQVAAQTPNVFGEEKIQIWVRAQQEAAKRGTLSLTRRHYMVELLQREDWVETERPWEAAV
jgi:hypothetical protein